MKLVKSIIALAMIGMLVYTWVTVGESMVSSGDSYGQLVARGDSSSELELYMDAYEAYTEALSLSDSEILRIKQIKALTDYYEKEQFGSYEVRRKLLQKLDDARQLYSDNLNFAMQEIDMYVVEQQYSEAAAICREAREIHPDNEELNVVWKKMTHLYHLGYKYYLAYKSGCDGIYVVDEGDSWSVIGSNEKSLVSTDFEMIGIVGNNGYYVAQEEELNVRFYDMYGIARGVVLDSYLDAGMWQDGMCPVKKAESDWRYVDGEGREQDGSYLMAGCFQNGMAAVLKQENEWSIIDLEGKDNGRKYFDVHLDLSGSYMNQGYMLAAENEGVYGIYDSNLTRVGNFICDDMDIPTDDRIYAFEKNGKWGYVDCDGNVLIDPQYDDAKSFQNGLAAVCVDGMWGFIKNNGETVVEPVFYDVGYVSSSGTVMVSVQEGYYNLLSFEFYSALVDGV